MIIIAREGSFGRKGNSSRAGSMVSEEGLSCR